MIEQGTDGLSRGDHSQGVMRGIPMTAYVPLHLNAFERDPRLKTFIEFVTQDMNPTFLTPEGWFDEGHGTGTFVCPPPPAAADVVVEQLGKCRTKRPHSMHLI
eukprot:scaffold71692_cov50-Attheya_sp.AAC.1